MTTATTAPVQSPGSASVDGPRVKRRRRDERTSRRVQPEYFVVPLLLVALWEIAVMSGVLDARLVPAPHTVLQTWWTWAVGDASATADPYNGTWPLAVFASAQRVFFGFFLAAVAGIAIGLLIGWFRLPRVLMQPVIDILRPIPVTAWVPFAVVFFGIRPAASVSLIALGSFFSIALNATAGAMGTPKVLVSAAQMLGTSPRKMLWRVVLPSALPSILTGLRVGLALAWVLVIVSEMVAVKSGLGFSLWDAYYFGRMDVIVAAMFSVGILGYLSDQVLRLLSTPILRWAPDVR